MSQLRFRKPVILFSSGVAFSYLVYRVLWTLNLTSAYAIFVSLFLYVAELYGVMNMLLYFLQVWDTTEPPQQSVPPGRTVDVFVPTYNEDPDMLRVTLQACVRMNYPHKTYLCDDGGTEARINDPEKGPPSAARAATLKKICEEVGAIYRTRPENKHAKAGNLNYAFGETDGEFIIIFDADHVPDPNFITRLIGYFADEKLGFVQTPHAFYNFESFQARLNHDRRQYWEEGQLFYHVIQPGRNRWNAPIFAGSAAMFRRAALEDVGFIAMETITEDMHTGLRMHSKGWKSLGIGERMISGQAAQDVTTFHSQRLRWGEGNMSVIAHDNPLTMSGLSWGQRLCYFATMINWCGGVFKIPIYLTPLLMLFTGVPPVRGFNWVLCVFMVAYMAASILGTKYVSNGYGSVWYSELFVMASFWTQVRGTMRALFMRKFQMFVVTAKRGRQAKSIWPYVRPQVYLIAVSVLALLWAWGRIWLGLSDDYFKPILASFWALLHLTLAYLVVRRACWPDDRRYSTRHIVYLPVAYEAPNAESPCSPALGVSLDLNERGMGLIAYQRLSVGDTLRLTVHSPNESVTVAGVIRSARELSNLRGAAGGQPNRGFRYGIEFQGVETTQLDGLNHISLHYAVPRLYRYYAEGHQSLPRTIFTALARRFFWRRFAERREYHLPMFLHANDPSALLPTVTEDLSRTSAAILVPAEQPIGREIELRLVTPACELRGRARVLRNSPRVYAARTFYLCVLEFTHFDQQGWDTVQELFHSSAERQLALVLKPRKMPMPVPMNRRLAAALALAVPLVGVEFGLFRWFNRDDFFLREVVALNRPITPEETARIDRILHATLDGPYPSTDRLVLLGHALQRMDRRDDLAQIIIRLAPRDRNNLELRLALAHAHAQREDFEAAEAEFQRLLAELDRGLIHESRREELLAAAARSAIHSGDLPRACELYRLLLQAKPDAMEYRNEFAGVLLSARQLAEAADLYKGVEPDDDGRILLVLIYSEAGKYVDATREARVLVKNRPGDSTAQGLLADVLQLQGNHAQAHAIYQRLLNSNVSDLRIVIQLAHSSLRLHNYSEALERFQTALDRCLERPELLHKYRDLPRAYINAAASAPEHLAAQKITALALCERALSTSDTDAVYLTRLAWVLHRLGEDDKATTLLEEAVALDPTDPAIRRQIAAVFIAAGKADPARKLLEGIASEQDVQLLLADSYSMNRDFGAAARICRAILREHPEYAEVRVRLANILSWNKEYAESLKLFEELAHAEPNNPVYPVRLAEVSLWSGDYGGALKRFEALLRADFDRPELWWGFVDAAAAAPALTEWQGQVARAIGEKALAGDHKPPKLVEAFRKSGKPLAEAVFLTRLAALLRRDGRDQARAALLLDRTLALAPHDPATRKELAGVLAATGRFKEALRLYEGLALKNDDRLALARIHAGAGDFDAAAELCRRVLEKQSLDKDAQFLLADVLGWGQHYSESLALLDRLILVYPTDPTLLRRRAEVMLWSGDPVEALRRLQAILEPKADQPALWPSFLEAAGQCERLTPEQTRLTTWIVDRPMDNVEFLTKAAWVRRRHLNDPAGADTLLRGARAKGSHDPALLARLGWVLFRSEDKAGAEEVLKQALALRSKSVASRRELAGVLVATQHFTEAHALYEELSRENPADRSLQSALAEATLWIGNHAQAVERIEKLLLADFKKPALWRSFIDAAAGSPTLTEAQRNLLLRVAAEPPPVTDPDGRALYLSRLAWVFQREAERSNELSLHEKAVVLLDQALAAGPKDAKARRELAGVLVAARRFKEALALCEALADANPLDVELQTYTANVTLWSGQPVKALARFERLLQTHFEQPALWPIFVDAAAAALPGQMTAEQVGLVLRLADRPVPAQATEPAAYLSRLAWTLNREGKKETALALLEKALTLNPKKLESRRELAGLLTALGRHKEALTLLEEMARANPTDADLRGRIAQATLWNGDPAKALELLQRHLVAQFDRPALWGSFVDAASGLDQGKMTREQIQLAARLAKRPAPDVVPDKTAYYSRLAWVLHREGLAKEADGVLAKAIALKPSDPASRRELARVLVATGQTESGLRLYQGLALDREDHFQLIVLHAAGRQFAEAEQHCRAILKERPDDFRARRWLADVSLWSNQYASAIGQYQALLTANFEQPALWPSFAEAASFVPLPNAEQLRLIEGVTESSASSSDAVFLARLALVRHRHVEIPRLLAEHAVLTLGTLGSAGSVGPLLAASRLVAEQDRPTTARRLWQRALRVRPKEPLALARLAWVTHRFGLTERAAQLLDEAIALRPAEPAVRRELGDVLVALGRLPEALRWFEDLTAAFPANRDVQVRVAEVTVWAGQYEQGLDRIGKLLTFDFAQQRLWPTFVDAASSAKSMTGSQVELAVRLANQPIPVEDTAAQTLYLSRLSWALFREAQGLAERRDLPRSEDLSARSTGLTLVNVLLDRALRLRAPEAHVRQELAGVLTAARRCKDALTLYEGLAGEDPENVELRIRLAELTLWGGDPARGLERFEWLVHGGERQPRVLAGFVAAAAAVPSITREQGELAWQLSDHVPVLGDKTEEALFRSRLAWTLLREGRSTAKPKWVVRADVLLDRAATLKPDEPAARRELAGVLAAAGRFEGGLALFKGVTLEREDRLPLTALYVGARKFDEAQRQAEAVLAEQPDNLQARLWLARVSLGRGQSKDALKQVENLLEEDFHRPELWRLFADAAGSADTLTGEQVRLAERIAEQPLPKHPEAVACLTRLAWAFYRQGQQKNDDALRAKGAVLAEQALALHPRTPAERRELAGVMLAAGRPQTARQLLASPTEGTTADRALLIHVLAAEKNFDEAEVEARKLAEQQPGSFESQLLLADVLGWNRKPAEAIRICEALFAAHPDEARLPRKLTFLNLAARRYDEALRLFHQLLDKDWQQPELWPGYVDAAASAKTLPPQSHKTILLRISERARQSTDAVYLTRFGWVMRQLGESARSIALLNRALELDPTSREIRRNLADGLQAAGQYDEAESHYQYLLRNRTPRP
jgi:tetratricopeptide (TPR) repeat protein/cellulose synthase/poly-beta-1,6-N-acetylglucosamine synthase-like glycosyltransferase